MTSKHEHGRTLARELSTSLALTVLVVVLVAGGGYYLSTRAAAETHLREDAQRWTEQLAEVSVLHLWNVDRAGLENACKAALQPPEVLGARVLDMEGRTLAQVSRPGETQPRFLTVSEEVVYTDTRVQQQLGSVELWVGRANLDARTEHSLRATGLLGLLAVAAVVLACQILLRRFLATPLDRLEEGIERIAAGDYASQLPPARQEDINAIVRGVNAMAAAIASREEELRSSQEQLRYALSAAQGGVWDWDVHGGTVYFSERWKSMLGYADDEIENTFESWERLLHPDDKAAAQAAVEEHLLGETEHYVFEHRLLCKDGTYRWIAARGKLISRTPDGKPQRFVGTHTDITQQIQAAEQLREAKEAAEEATRAKDEFLANMSHEIRTPLNGILGMTSVLLEAELSEEQQECAETIRNSGDGLLAIVNDILDFSRIESGALTILDVPFDPSAVCREVEEILAKVAQDKGLSLKVDCGAGVPPAVRGDPGRTRQILLNLVGNAIKFTDEGEVRLALSCQQAADGRARLRYEVQDTGVGIAPGEIEDLFHRFSQLDSSRTRTRGGTGLGLAICRRFTELMGGQIGAESELGKGSTFWVELSLATCPAESLASPGPATTNGWEPPVAGSRVLLAEDNRVNARVAQTLLRRLALEVDTVANGEQALLALERGRYDLVLMDVQMPELDGLRAVEEIRRREEREGHGERIPIMALTASALPSDRQRCLEAGMDDYLPKPITLDILERKVSPWLNGRRGKSNDLHED